MSVGNTCCDCSFVILTLAVLTNRNASKTTYDPVELESTKSLRISAQFDPDYFLRPKTGGEGWFGSGKEPTGLKPSGSGGSGGGAAAGLHAEQHFEYHLPLKAGDVLSATTKPGNSWEKESKRAGKLKFSESVTEYRNQDGDLVITATGVGVQTERPVDS